MKKRRGSLLQRMMAVLFAAVLTAGMVSNAVPVSVLAAGDSITQDGRNWNIPDTVNISVGEEKYSGITGGGAAFYNETYSFASSDSAVATVRAEGGGYTGFYVTGISEGTATITFTCSYKVTNAGETKSVSGSFDVVVTAADKYTVTVNNGTGGGEYEADATVTITANAPASGKQFDRWLVGRGGVTLADPMSSPTTFTMPEQDVDVSATYKDITEEHTHSYGDWQHDDAQHWKVCACGEETERGNHDFENWITDREATATEAGTKHRECQTCGYRQTETIPATGTDPGSGTVTPEVKPGANAPATDISTPAEELKDMLLTDEEKQQVQNGTNIRIVLEVQDAGNTVSSSDKEAVAQALNGFTVGQYLNIDLYKLAEAERTDIHETAKKIKIVIAVPEALRNADSSKTRTFAVVRVHDGRAELLADLDGSADTITIETDRFSTYAIVYQDTANGGGGNNGNDNNNGGGNDNGGSGNNGNGNNNGGSGNNGSGNNSGQNNSGINNTKTGSAKDNEPATGDAAPLEIYATLAMIAGFSYVLLYFTDRKRGMTEETKRELVSRLVGWAKQGGRIRKYLALAAVFVLLVYYHSIGKKTCVEWKEIYGE